MLFACKFYDRCKMLNIELNKGQIFEIEDGQEIKKFVKSQKLKNVVAAKVDGVLVDLSYVLTKSCQLVLVDSDSQDGLEIIRHSTAHLLAHAVKELYPKAQVTIGPVIEDGFYYDFSYEPGFNPEDLNLIEKKMHQLAKKNATVTREVMARSDAIALFESMGEHYKAKIISDIDEGEPITLYRHGDFIDLCRGPHVPQTGVLRAFKLMKLAGAYWRGDENNEMLQRIYGTSWASEAQLKAHLHQLEEAEKRDHRKLAKTMDLFHMQDTAPGMVFWHNNGLKIFHTVVDYMRKRMREYDYEEISTPVMMDQSLWVASGHWEKFRDNMYVTETDDKVLCIKPMNCPGGIQVYNIGLKSYKELPIRIGEFGFVHRNEVSGALNGLKRLKGFTQDDAHVFCTPDQLQDEIVKLIELVHSTYSAFGFNSVIVKIATRPEKRIGTDAEWDLGEQSLIDACHRKQLQYELAPGEGAFYGPKIEFHLKDCIGRTWQCGTIQVDYSMPARLGAQYVNQQGEKSTPIMIHRAIFGSLERFIGVLLEQYSGCLPLWLAPIQIAVAAVSDQFSEYALQVVQRLKQEGFNVVYDRRSEKLGYKIREATLKKIPYLMIVGEKEQNDQTVSIRCVNGQQVQGLQLDALIKEIHKEISEKAAPTEDFAYALVNK